MYRLPGSASKSVLLEGAVVKNVSFARIYVKVVSFRERCSKDCVANDLSYDSFRRRCSKECVIYQDAVQVAESHGQVYMRHYCAF